MPPWQTGTPAARPLLFTDPQMTVSVAPEQPTHTPPKDSTPRHQHTPRGKSKDGTKNKQAPRARKAHPVLEKLFELYPDLFGARFLPLKLGTFQDLMAAHPDAFERGELKVALGLHARSTRYLQCVASGLPRHDLQGHPVEPVAPEHVHHAILEIFKRRQARSAEDLRPAVRAQLIQAFEASGLDRQAYIERVRKQDEAANTLLDEAFAEWAAQRARHEALLRAFEASGSTLEQFADMYGLPVATATLALEQARRHRQSTQASPT